MLRTPSRPLNQRPARQEQPEPDNEAEVVASLPRSDGSELQVALASFRGHPFVRIQLFKPDYKDPDVMRPTPRLVTIKIHELEDFRDAIDEVISRLQAAEDRTCCDDLPAGVGRR